MTEAAVALTDFGLALEAGAFAWLINRGRTGRGGSCNQALSRWFVLFFCAATTASITGGAVHGF